MLLSKSRYIQEIGSVCLFVLLVRWVASLHPYSGKGKSPMFGDFEAQRHWMEVTYNLPAKQWYHNSSENDLNYWGLDYPPLTAYHSWLCGFVASTINASWVALPESRGIETESHKLFMRVTAILADIFIYIPAICALVYQRRTVQGGFPYIIRICTETCVALLSPAQILIDHGHFQYNCISLGFTAWAILAINKRHDFLAAVLFSLALNYKQMSLYLAFPFFFYLLGRCVQAGFQKGLLKLFFIGTAVLGTFAVCWWPFLSDHKDALQVLNRLFPFSRGIFEDKVANIWCTLNVLLKLHSWNVGFLTACSSLATLSGCLISGLDLFRNPNDVKFRYALLNSGLVFFLFSFQVHEKGILLAALPATVLLADDPLACTWFLAVSALSMFPLLLKDGLAIPCFATVALFVILSCAFLDWAPKESEDSDKNETDGLPHVLMGLSLVGFIILCFACVYAPVSPKLPDLWPLLISVYSCGHFVLFLVYFHVQQFNAKPLVLKSRMKVMKMD